MNNVSLTGRATKAPETRYGGEDNNLAISRFCIAVDDYNSTDFINIRCLGKTAEWVEKWVSKGTKVEITGKIKTGSYTNRDGQKVYYTEVLANTAGFGETKAEADARRNSAGAAVPPPAPTNTEEFMTCPDEELPFH